MSVARNTESNSATLLVLKISSHSLDTRNFSVYSNSIRVAARKNTRRLYVYLVNPALACPAHQRASLWNNVQSLSTFVYSSCLHEVSPSVEIFVLFDGWSQARTLFQERWKYVLSNSTEIDAASQLLGEDTSAQIIEVEDGSETGAETVGQDGSSHEGEALGGIPMVTVNGTFDHLHHGHKNHLALALWLASDTLICSISPDDNSLQERKKYAVALQSYSTRVAAIHRFFRIIRDGFGNYDEGATPSTDVKIICIPKISKLGAQVTESNLHAAVLSTESAHFSKTISEARQRSGFPPIDIFTVDTVAARDIYSEQTTVGVKLSSSSIRRTLMERQKIVVLINGQAGVGKHTIAQALSKLLPKSRVIDNHLLVDLADALCSRNNPSYSLLRGEIRRLVFNHIATIDGEDTVVYIFTSNFSVSTLGSEAALDIQNFSAHVGARFVPVNVICSKEEMMRRVASPGRHLYSRGKITDPLTAASTYDRKHMYEYKINTELKVDISALSASDAANFILTHVKSFTA